MNEEANNQPGPAPGLQPNTNSVVGPPLKTTGEKVIQPPASLTQNPTPPPAQPAIQAEPVVTSPQLSQPTVAPNPASAYPGNVVGQTPSMPPPADAPAQFSGNQLPYGLSASQRGLNQSQKKLLDFKPKGFVKGFIALMVIGVVFAILVMTKVITLSEFKNVSYTNAKGVRYSLDFYSRHKTTQLSSGNQQLLSEVSKGSKFPISISIATGDLNESQSIKGCTTMPKVFDVKNDNVHQTIAICNPLGNSALSGDAKAGIYIGGFTHDNQTHIVTISQDLSGADISSQSAAQETLTKFGMQPYENDIKRIVGSIKVE